MVSFMEIYVKNMKAINLISRMDYHFWSPRKELSEFHEIRTIKECVGRDNITASAFYPSIVPYYSSKGELGNGKYEPFIRVTDVRNGLLDFDKTVFLSVEILDELSSSIKRVKSGDVVITKGGEYIGEAALVPDYYDKYGTCRDVLCISMKNANIQGEYLASYLQSKHGKNELIRTRSAQGQPHLTIDKVAGIRVPIYSQDFQDQISTCWELFYQLMDESNTHFENAKYIFNDTLSHKIDENEKVMSFVKKVKANRFAQRFDVEYFENRWTNLVNELKEEGYQFKTISYIKEEIKPQKSQEVFNYITLSDIDDRSGIIKEPESLEAYRLPDRAKRKVQKGDVIVSSLKGSKEKVAIVNSEKDNLVASTGFYVIRDKNYLPEVLYLIFRSKYYDLFIEQMSSGAIMSSITEKYFKQFLIPEINKEVQKEIAEEVIAYMITRKLAFEHLDQAITKFDKMADSDKI